MTTNALAKKLQIREGSQVALLNAPADFASLLDPLPADAQLHTDSSGKFPVVIIFVQNQAELAALVNPALAAVVDGGILWAAYPKKTSKIPTDLNRDAGWEPLFSRGFEPVAMVAVDATWSAMRLRHSEVLRDDVTVESHFSGAKAALLPIYHHLAELITGFGGDVQITPRQSYVAFARAKQFAQVRAATKDRVELAVKLPGATATGRWQPLKAQDAPMTHRLALTEPEQVDASVQEWLHAAYDAAA
jgi:hypothetical protein